jgi:PAS domain S-box-containing protein
LKKDNSILNNNEQLRLFRQKAERILSSKIQEPDATLSVMQVEELLHELQVFQIELEMQNDELKFSSEVLDLERKKFSGLYDLAPVGYFILDQFGVIKEVNRIGAEMLGLAKSALTRKRLQLFIANDNINDFYAFFHKLNSLRPKQSCQLRLKSNDSQPSYAQIEGVGIRNAEGNMEFFIAVIDVTESREAEQRLKDTNERLRMTLEASATGIWEIDLDKKSIYLDDYSYTIYGYHPWEFDGRYETFFETVHPDDIKYVKNVFGNVVQLDKDLDLGYRIISKDGVIKHLRVRGHLIESNKNKRFVGIMIDVTNSKQLEEETENLRKNQQKNINVAALQVQENERKRISESLHDSVSQLLYAIRLNFQNYQETSSLKEYYTTINQLLDQAIKETRNISFELAPSVLTDFGLREGIKEMIKRISTPNFTIKAQLNSLKERLEPDLEITVFRIVQELLNNSIKHGQATEAQVKIAQGSHQTNIHMSDNGVGFNSKDTDYLLKGSGLRSIKNRVGLFNGSIDIKSAPGKGTSINIHLQHDN